MRIPCAALWIASPRARANRIHGMQRFGDDDEEIHLTDQQANSGVPVARGFGESAMAQPVGVAELAAAAAGRWKPLHAGKQGNGFRRRRHLEAPDPGADGLRDFRVPIRTLGI